MNLALVGWLFLCYESATATATQCLSCAPMPTSVLCVITETCPSGQECYAKYVLKTDGTVMHEFGCHDSQTCTGQIGTNSLIGKRDTSDTDLCYKCCHGNMCNQGTVCTAPTTHVNLCHPSPCVRGACYIGSGNDPTFLCLCPRGFTGIHCETEINPCVPSPCARGSCFIGSENNPTFFCMCPSGFEGTYCETEINPCSPSPCVRGLCYKNNGNIPTYVCLCPSGFTGLNCETIITTPTTTPTPIQTTTATCSDKMPNCAAYGAGVCSDATYSAWVYENCPAFCHKCEGLTTRQDCGCVYNGQVYSQGQTWMDGCKFSCTCVDGSAGKYQCQTACMTDMEWYSPPCTLTPPPAGKCCRRLKCPEGFEVALPPGYVSN